MQYLLVSVTLIVALFGVFKDHFLPSWKSRLIPIVAFVLFISSLVQVWVKWHEEQLAKYRSETGVLRSKVKSTKKYPVLQLCMGGMEYRGDPSKPSMILGGGGDAIYLRMQEDEVKLSMMIRDANGIVIITITDNIWFVPKLAVIMDRNFTNDMLEVLGPRKEIMLQVQVAGEKAKLAGITYTKDGAGPMTLNPLLSECANLGETLFKYPSTMFPGEMRK